MKALHRKPVLIVAALALLGGATLQTVASAQSESLSEVLVEGGPVTRTVVGRGIYTNSPIERTAVDYHVSYSDLDLGKDADVLALQGRVESAARSACGQLDELFPVDSSYHKTRACIEEAIRGAAKPIQQAVEGRHGQVNQE